MFPKEISARDLGVITILLITDAIILMVSPKDESKCELWNLTEGIPRKYQYQGNKRNSYKYDRSRKKTRKKSGSKKPNKMHSKEKATNKYTV